MLRLWICLHLPSLPLEVFRPSWSTELAVAVLEKERVHLASRMAADAGVRAQMRRGGVQTIAPQTVLYERAPQKEAEALHNLSMALLQFSPNVAEAEEAAVLVDVSASLRLFGGVRKIRRRICNTARALGFTAAIGCAPTAQGAWLLARAGGGTALKADSLERQLAALPVGTLPPARPYLEWLEAPPTFSARVELPDRIEHAEATLLYARGLIVQMIGWLTAHHLAVTRISLELQHERGREALPSTVIEIALAEPTWSEDHLVRLLRERLAQLQVDAPMIAVRLTVTNVQDKAPPSETLFPEPGGTPEDHARVMELLVARLGADNILRPDLRADYRPEVANAWVPAVGKPPATIPIPSLPRPAWLLDKPIALLMRDHRPFYGSPLRLVSPPERIEGGWWDGELVTRDYYVAEGRDHTHYWVYSERMGSREGDEARWYLHGLFG